MRRGGVVVAWCAACNRVGHNTINCWGPGTVAVSMTAEIIANLCAKQRRPPGRWTRIRGAVELVMEKAYA